MSRDIPVVRRAFAEALEHLSGAACDAVRHEIRREAIACERMITAWEAALLLDMTEAAVRKAASRGGLPCHRIGRRLRFKVGDLLSAAKSDPDAHRWARTRSKDGR